MVAEDVGLDLQRVLDEQVRGAVAQLARVADLAAALGIERRVVEDDHDVVARLGACATGLPSTRSATTFASFARRLLVAVEVDQGARVLEALRRLELAGLHAGIRLLASCAARWQRLEPGAVDRDAALAADVGREVDREANVSCSLNARSPSICFVPVAERRLEYIHAVCDGLEEALLLLLQHLGDALLARAQLGVRIAHQSRQRGDELVEERRARTELVAVADGTARDARRST